MIYRGRFAPTPSGDLHLGSLVAALASYLDARAADGQWLVRIEDVDTQRSRKHFESAILFELERHGLHWDGEVVRQSQRTRYYDDALQRLYTHGLAYRCHCSRSKLSKSGCPRNPEGEFIYPAICRPEFLQASPEILNFRDLQTSYRFRVDSLPTVFVDEWLGTQSICVFKEAGDFLLRRSDGNYAYNLAVVVDDFDQGINNVVRGMDILPLTARQVLLQKALGYSTPRYKHCPLVLSPDGAKLSKSSSARALKESAANQNLTHALKFLGIEIRALDGGSCGEILDYSIDVWRKKQRFS